MKIPFSTISDDDSFNEPMFQPIKRKTYGTGGNPEAGVKRVEMPARRKAGNGSDSRNAVQRRQSREY